MYESKPMVKALHAVKKVAADQSVNHQLKPKDYHFFTWSNVLHPWEVYSIIVGDILSTVVCGLLVVFLVTLVFVPHPMGACYVAPVVAAIYVELIGGLQLAGFHVNSITAIGMIMTIGLVVDYNMHVVIAYFEVKPEEHPHIQTRDDRVKHVLKTMGHSVLLGGSSTFLGVLLLAFSSSIIFQTIFVVVLQIVVLGVGHGLIFTPVVLSCLGPCVSQTSVTISRLDVDLDEEVV